MRPIHTAAVALLFATGLAGPAFAHAHLRSSEPASGSTATTAPAAVTITYTEGIEPRFSTIEVQDAAGKRVDKNDAQLSPQDNKVFSVGLPSLPAGTYKVIWHATAVDTHKTEGSFDFTIKP